ncbi:MAG: S1 RNA-binding domain-containing protein [Chloroflexi bacterium]|nr:S1 RNA-binding domain-containing protein [Chloroflexota bacterium]
MEMIPEEEPIRDSQSAMWDLLNQEYAVRLPRRGEIIPAEVVRIGPEGMVVDIGAKREGLVPQEDLDKLDPQFRSQILVGSRLSAYVLQPEGQEGNVILSINLARVEEEWQSAERYLKDGEIYEGKISGHNKGGLIVPFGQIRGFVPASQILDLTDHKVESRSQNLAAMVGETLALKVIEVDRSRQRLIFSERAAQREARDRRKEKLITELNEGEIRRGQVSGLSQFGAFVDLGGADGLIHISELSYKRVAHPRELLQVGQEVEVYVLKVDRERKRIGLSLRRLQPDPWEQLEERFQVGQIVEGRITKVAKFGAFAAVDDGIEGLIHSSEIGEENNVQEGDLLPLKIISIDPAHRRIGLSLKRAPARDVQEPMSETLPLEQIGGEVTKSGEQYPPSYQAEALSPSEVVAEESAIDNTEVATPATRAEEPIALAEKTPAEIEGASSSGAEDLVTTEKPKSKSTTAKKKTTRAKKKTTKKSKAE